MNAKEDTRRKGLGRGLSALLGDDMPLMSNPTAALLSSGRGPEMIAIDLIEPNPNQPRKRFDEGELEELTASIREKGIIQPLVLRRSPRAEGRYEIVAGERRWRAAQRARLHELPCVVRDLSDTEVIELAIIENIQRADLNPVEEAQSFQQLIDSYGHTQEQLAKVLGKSRSYIANAVRLLALPEEVLEFLRNGQLSAGHARALITAEDPVGLARLLVEKGLTVRDAERLAKVPSAKATTQTKPVVEKDVDTRALEADLSAMLGFQVTIQHRGSKGGELRITYESLEALDDLCQRLNTPVTRLARG